MTTSRPIGWVFGALGGLLFVGCSSRFTDTDIRDCKADIAKTYSEQEGTTVKEVVLVREGPRKLTGFIKILVKEEDDEDGTPGDVEEDSLDCSATMDSGGEYFWKCD